MNTLSNLVQIIFSSLESGSVYALAALGIILIFRTSRVTNFAQGTIGMFSAYVATVFAMKTGVNEFIAAFIGILSALVVGVVIDLIVMRPAKKASGVSKQMLTFAIIMVLLGIAPLIFGSLPLQFGRFIKEGSVSILGASITYNAILNIFTGIIIMVALFFFLQYTKWGLAVRATASNEDTSQLMGVPTEYVNMASWAVAAALSVLAALMVAPNTVVSVSIMDMVQIFALIACVLGGFQTFYGPVVGAYLIAFGKNFISFYVSSTWSLAILYILILLIVIILPNGLFGKKVVKKV